MEKLPILAKLQDFWYETRIDFLKSFSYVWSFLHVKILLVIIFTINIINWLFARFIDQEVGLEKIALHYSVDFGIDLYGDTKNIFIIPVLGFIFIFFNFFLVLFISKYVKSDIKFISYILLVSALIANIILLVSTTSIYLINFK